LHFFAFAAEKKDFLRLCPLVWDCFEKTEDSFTPFLKIRFFPKKSA